MKKVALSFILLAGCVQYCFAQADNNVPEPRREKKKPELTHQVGVQLNGLIRQVFNFNNSTTNTNTNPYLLTYSLNFRSGWGARLGVGYNYTSNKVDDGITVTETKVNTMRGRIGGEKLFKLSDKWTTGAGLDFVYNMNNDVTSNTVIFSDTTITVTKSKGTGMGGGPMAWLRYHVTDHILIGTEASFYYVGTSSKNEAIRTTKTFDQFGSGSIVTVTQTTTKPKTSEGVFNSPIVFYIIVKF